MTQSFQGVYIPQYTCPVKECGAEFEKPANLCEHIVGVHGFELPEVETYLWRIYGYEPPPTTYSLVEEEESYPPPGRLRV